MCSSFTSENRQNNEDGTAHRHGAAHAEGDICSQCKVVGVALEGLPVILKARSEGPGLGLLRKHSAEAADANTEGSEAEGRGATDEHARWKSGPKLDVRRHSLGWAYAASSAYATSATRE